MLQVDLVTILTYTIYRQIIGISHGIEKGVAATTPFLCCSLPTSCPVTYRSDGKSSLL